MTVLRHVPMQYVAEIDPGKSKVAHLPDGLPVSFLPMEDVGLGGLLQPTEIRRLGDVREGYTYMRDGDVTFAKISPSFQNGKGGRAKNLTSGLGFATTELTILRPSRVVDARYLQYVISSDHFLTAGAATLHGVAGQQRVDSRFVRDFKVPLPSLDVQRRVADMLDVETARIDTLIAKNNEAVSLNLRRRNEGLARAVTEGLDGAPCRMSGLDWAQGVATGFDVAPYQYLARIGTGHTPSRSDPSLWTECNIHWVTTGDVKSLRPGRRETLSRTAVQISEAGIRNSAAVLHPEGTVFLSRTASVGFSGIMGSDMATSQDFFTWTCGPRLHPKYMLYVLRSMKSRGQFDRMMYGSTHKTIYFPDLMELRGPVPPFAEQHRIADHCSEVVTRAGNVEDRMRRLNELLVTRRQSLITAAVTGQITV